MSEGYVLPPTQIEFGIGTLSSAEGDRLGVVRQDRVMALSDICARFRPPAAPPASMGDLLAYWDTWHDWLRSLPLEGRESVRWLPLDAVRFKAPVPNPPNIFQTYHNFDRPNRVTGAIDPPKAERYIPDIFLGSRSALAGYDDVVYIEQGGAQFDFEVEVTAVVGKVAHRVPVERAEDFVAGYAIANDFTMHQAWWQKYRAHTPIPDIIRMKNFPGYTPMSRVIVPRDLVGDPRQLSVRTWVGDELRQDTRTDKMLWSVAELLSYLSWIMPLHPGDLILCGSPEELPPRSGKSRGVRAGERVICEVERLGALSNRIQLQDVRNLWER